MDGECVDVLISKGSPRVAGGRSADLRRRLSLFVDPEGIAEIRDVRMFSYPWRDAKTFLQTNHWSPRRSDHWLLSVIPSRGSQTQLTDNSRVQDESELSFCTLISSGELKPACLQADFAEP